MALWNVNWCGPCLAEGIDNVVTRAARINYFCKHVTIEDVNKTHLLANLSWFLYHPKHTLLGKLGIMIRGGSRIFRMGS